MTEHEKKAEREAIKTEARKVAEEICRDVANLPDRSSPDDWPEAMLVTGVELMDICEQAIEDAIRSRGEAK